MPPYPGTAALVCRHCCRERRFSKVPFCRTVLWGAALFQPLQFRRSVNQRPAGPGGRSFMNSAPQAPSGTIRHHQAPAPWDGGGAAPPKEKPRCRGVSWGHAPPPGFNPSSGCRRSGTRSRAFRRSCAPSSGRSSRSSTGTGFLRSGTAAPGRSARRGGWR